MKNRKFWVSLLAGIMALIMILSLLASLLPTVVFAKSSKEIKEEINKLKKERSSIWSEIDELEEQQDNNWDSIEEMVTQKNNIDQQINLLHAEIANINEQVRNYSLLIAENQVALDEAERVLEELNAKMKELIDYQKISYKTMEQVRSLLSDITVAKNNREIYISGGASSTRDSLRQVQDMLEAQNERQQEFMDELSKNMKDISKQ